MKLLIVKKKTLVWFALLLAAILIVIIGVTAVAPAMATVKKTPIYSVGTTEKKVALSFDACWGADKTADILARLEQYDVPATYFVVSSWADKYADKLQMLTKSGRVEVGSHSVTHSHMSRMSEKAIRAELVASKQTIQSITGKEPILFRPPYGDYNNTLVEACAKEGLYPIQWDVDSLDWKELSASAIAARVLKSAREGSIILMHNDGKHTVDALPMIIMGLKNKGYEFVWISDLIYRDGYTIDNTGRQLPTT